MPLPKFKLINRIAKPLADYRIVERLTDLVPYYLTLPKRYCAIDTETTGLRPRHGDRPFFVSGCDQDFNVVSWRAHKIDYASRTVVWSRKQLNEIQDYYDSFPVCFMHNAGFDFINLELIGIRLDWSKIRDSLLDAHCIDSAESHGLKYQAKKYFGIDDDDQVAMQKSIAAGRRALRKSDVSTNVDAEFDYLAADPDLLREYGEMDARRTALLPTAQIPIATEYDVGLSIAREHALLPVIHRIANRGIAIRKEWLLRKRDKYAKQQPLNEKRLTDLARIKGYADFNPRSQQQLTGILYGHGKTALGRRSFNLPILGYTKSAEKMRAEGKTPNPSTDADTVKLLIASVKETEPAYRFLTALQRNRIDEKAIGYLDEYNGLTIPKTESYPYHPEKKFRDAVQVYILPPNLNQVGDVDNGMRSTRFSSSDPNLQNVSVKSEMSLRDIFIPRPGHYWVDADYDNLEMRLLAYASGEKRLIELFESGGSYHLYIAELLYGPRQKWKGLNTDDWKKSPEYKRTKNGNFSLGYGAGRAKADATYGVDGAYDRIKHTFTEWTAYNRAVIRDAEKLGYVKTMFGYRLTIEKSRAFTTALNGVIQGTAGDVMKYAMLAVAECPAIINNHAEQLLTVHDQLITEFPLPYMVKEVCPPIPYRRFAEPVLSNVAAIKHAMEYPSRRLGIPLPVTPDIVTADWSKKISVEL